MQTLEPFLIPAIEGLNLGPIQNEPHKGQPCQDLKRIQRHHPNGLSTPS